MVGRTLAQQPGPFKEAHELRALYDRMRAVAEERSREINAAYDLIKSARGIV